MKKAVIRKVGVYDLLIILEELHSKGVDFVDMVGSIGEEEDTLGLIFNEDYINPDFKGKFEEEDEDEDEENEITFTEEPKIKAKFSDDDLDNIV